MVLFAAAATFEESYRAGLQALQQNRLPEAKTELEAATKLKPDSGGAWLALAQTYRKLQDAADAERAADRAARLVANQPAMLRLLAAFYSEGRQWEKADAEFQAAIRSSPYDESLAFDYAQSLLSRQRFDAALVVLVAARKNFDKSAQIELALGVSYYGLRRYREAAASFERTIALAPDVEQPYVFLGKMLDQIPDRVPRLVGVFADYAKRHPESGAACLLHAKALLAQSPGSSEPEGLLRRAAALDARLAEAHSLLGALLQQQHRFRDAGSEFEIAAKLAPEDAATYYHLAQIYDRLGLAAQAQTARARHAELMSSR